MTHVLHLLSELKRSGLNYCYSSICSRTGVEYEYILQEKLNNLNINYLSEEEMRSRGYPKTPDIKLEIPISYSSVYDCAHGCQTVCEGHVINWIESKALFGDSKTHSHYVHSQLQTYKNR